MITQWLSFLFSTETGSDLYSLPKEALAKLRGGKGEQKIYQEICDNNYITLNKNNLKYNENTTFLVFHFNGETFSQPLDKTH